MITLAEQSTTEGNASIQEDAELEDVLTSTTEERFTKIMREIRKDHVSNI